MSKINELIKEMCPNGVEFKKLEDCCNILDNKRKPISKGIREMGEYPYYGANGIQDYISDYIFDGKYVLVGEDGSVQTPNGTPIVNWAIGKIWVNNHAHIIEEIDGVSLRYLYHYLQIVDVKDLIHGNIPKLNQSNFRNIKIAVPPLEVQEEIVKILDKFGELEAELEADLEARKTQYEFWRGKLLNSGNSNQQYITLGDIGKVCMCKRIMKNETSDSGDVPFYKIGTFGKQADAYISYDIFNDYKKRFSYPKKGEILVSCSGTIGRSVVFDGNDAYFQDSNIVWLSNDERKILNKFLYYFYQTSPWNISDGGTIKRLYNNQFISTKVPLYSLEKQKMIVSILERFDKLINDISEGLPAEIELRRKQYEYYRNKLLSFEELYYE